METCSSENLIESAVQKELETFELKEEDWDAFYETMQNRAEEAERGLVTITSVRQQTDLFNNPVETEGNFSGAVIAKTSDQYLIFTTAEAVTGMDSIQVRVSSGQEVPGQIVGVDNIAGLAVIGIQAELLEKSSLEQIQVLELGNSYAVQRGDLLTAIGSSAGYPQSSGFGAVSYIRENVQIIDGTSQILYVDVPGNADKGTFLIDGNKRLSAGLPMTSRWKTADWQQSGLFLVINYFRKAFQRHPDSLYWRYGAGNQQGRTGRGNSERNLCKQSGKRRAGISGGNPGRRALLQR